MSEIEKTCENCEYEHEDLEGTHCRHCIHNAEEHFKLKEIRATEQEIRNKAIDEFAERLKNHLNEFDFWKYGISDGTNYETRNYDHMIDKIAEQMKKGV